MQFAEQFDGAAVNFRLAGFGADDAGEQIVAQILQQQQAARQIGGQDGGRAEPQSVEITAERNKRCGVGTGETGQRIVAQGLALLRRGVGRAGWRFCGGRGVHQHGGGAG